MGTTESQTSLPTAAAAAKKSAATTTVAWKKFAVCYKQYVLTMWMHQKSGFSLLEEDRQPLLLYAASLGSTMLVAKCQTLEEPLRDHAELIANFVEESFGGDGAEKDTDDKSISSKEILEGADTVSTCRSLVDHINYVTKQRRRQSSRNAIQKAWKDYIQALINMVEGFQLDSQRITPNSDLRRRAIRNFETKARRVWSVLAQQRKENSI